MNCKHILRMAVALLLAVAGASAAPPPPPPLHVFSTIHADAIGQKLQSAMIWADAAQDKPGVAIVFRRTFELAAQPGRATLNIFADARYVLWVNGEYIDRGPCRFQPNGPEYDTLNLAPHLKPGANVIAVLVVGNLSGGKIMSHAPGLTARLELDGGEIFHTDANWKWSNNTRYRQVDASWANLTDSLVDARVEDGDWTQASYSDSGWKLATPISGKAWGGLTPRQMALLRENPVAVKFVKDARLPVALAAGEKLEFNVGRIVQAYPLVEFSADKDTELVFEPFGVHYFAKAGAQRYFTIDTRGISKGAIVVKSGKATITGFQLIERLYPFDRVGAFTCNDDFLNRLWTMCARSGQVLSEDSYVDCADRERVEWMDDDPPLFEITRTVMSAPGVDGRPVYGDPRLLGAMVRRTALTLQPEGWVKAHTCSDRYDIHAKMEDRACEWVAGIRRYYAATGDTALLREIWPAVVAQMDYFLECRTSRGLVRARDWVVWGNPLGYFTGETTTLNAFVQRALADAGFIGGVIGEKSEGKKFAKAADELARAINAILWDEADGCYYSGYFTDDDMTANQATKRQFTLSRTNNLTPPTLHANVFALERGVVSADRRARVVQKMLEQQRALKGGAVMIYHYVAGLLYGLDRPDLDTRVLELWRDNWQAMVQSPLECSWESFGRGSHAHCYGMFPGYFLSDYVLGVRRDAPVAEKKILIEPHLGDLTQAGGVVVTEFGPVPVSWEKEGGKLNFKITAPENATTTLALPRQPGLDSIQLDGATRTGTAQGSRLIFNLSPGAHTGSY